MKRLLIVCLAVLGLAGSAFAANQQGGPAAVLTTPTSDMALGSVTSSTVTISTSAVSQFDNAGGVLSGRTSGRLCNADTSLTMWCGFTTSVATSTVSAAFGEPWVPGECKNVNIAENISGYCRAAPSASASSIIALWRQFK